MAVRKDKVQVQVEIGGKQAGKTLGDLEKEARQLRRDMKGLVPDTDAFKKKSKELLTVKNRIKSVTTGFKETSREMNRGKSLFGKFSAGVMSGLQLIGGAMAAMKIVDFGNEFIQLADQQAKAEAKVATALQQTGGAVGKTLEELKAAASELQEGTLFGDEEILNNVTAQLLTFTNVAGDQFDRAQKMALDFATLLDGDVKGASIQLGKALNDPVKGLTAMSKAGVSFTKEQQSTVKALMETNRIADAQTLILNELERQYGGQAEAAAKAGSGPMKQFQNTLGDIKEELGEQVLPVFNRVAIFLRAGLQNLGPLREMIITTFEPFQRLALIIEKIGRGMGVISKESNGAAESVRFLSGAMEFILMPLTAMVEFLAMALELVPKISSSLVGMREMIISVGEDISSFFSGVGEVMSGNLDQGVERIKSTVSGMGEKSADAFRGGYSARMKDFSPFEGADTTAGVSGMMEQLWAQLEKAPKPAGLDLSGVDAGGSGKGKDPAKAQEEATKSRMEAIKAEEEQALAELKLAHAQQVVSEREKQEEIYAIRQAALTQRMEYLSQTGQEESIKFQELHTQELNLKAEHLQKLSELDQQDRDARAARAEEDKKLQEEKLALEMEEQALREEEELIRAELEWENKKLTAEQQEMELLEIKRKGLEERLAMLTQANLGESQLARQLQIDLLKNQAEFNQKSVAQQARAEESKKKVMETALGVAKDVSGIVIDLLGGEEAARKKNLAVIKAVKIGEVIANLFTEISGYFANPGSTASFGVAGGIQAAIAGVRAAVAVKKIASEKLSKGGVLKGPSHAGGGLSVINRATGQQVAEAEGGEPWLVLSRNTMANNGDIINRLISSSMFNNGAPIMREGGTITPAGAVATGEEAQQGGGEQFAMMAAEIQQLRADINSWQTNLRAYVSYSDVEDALDTVSEIQEEASIS